MMDKANKRLDNASVLLKLCIAALKATKYSFSNILTIGYKA